MSSAVRDLEEKPDSTFRLGVSSVASLHTPGFGCCVALTDLCRGPSPDVSSVKHVAVDRFRIPRRPTITFWPFSMICTRNGASPLEYE